jgi:hypothetical protein
MDDQAFPKVAQTQAPKRPKAIFILALFLIILGIVLFLGSRLLGTSGKDKAVESANTAPTAIIVPTDTPVPSEEPSPTEKVSPTTSVTPTKAPGKTTTTPADSVDKASGLDRADLTVEIQNGSGTSGAASKMSTFLKDLGYTIGSTGNADNFDYQNITIQVKSTKSKYLTVLKKDISASYTVGDTSSSLASTTADAVIIIGK